MLHSYVDESKDPNYLLVAALIHPAQVTPVRRAIAAMVLPHQRRIHFSKERNERRALIMDRLGGLPIQAIVYAASPRARADAQRDECLTALIHDHIETWCSAIDS